MNKRKAESQTESVSSRKRCRLEADKIVLVTPNRQKSLKNDWEAITKIVAQELKILIRAATRKGSVSKIELKVPDCKVEKEKTATDMSLQRAYDFLQAYMKGFTLEDAKVIARMDGFYVETFLIHEVKQSLKGDHKSRAIGRICGSNGSVKSSIEEATRTRIIVAGETLHVLGNFESLQVARRALCDLIMGRQPNKVAGRIKRIADNILSTL